MTAIFTQIAQFKYFQCNYYWLLFNVIKSLKYDGNRKKTIHSFICYADNQVMLLS